MYLLIMYLLSTYSEPSTVLDIKAVNSSFVSWILHYSGRVGTQVNTYIKINNKSNPTITNTMQRTKIRGHDKEITLD